MTAARLVLWRHGQTDWNASGRYQGQLDIPLNDTGRAQARAAAPHVAALGPTLLYSSDLSRARETAGSLADLTGLEVVVDPRFREIHCGSWQGYVSAQAFAEDPDFEVAIREGRDHRRSATGETAMEVGERVSAALRDVAATAPDGATVVVATHGLATKMATTLMLGGGYAQSLLLAPPENCSWTVLVPARGGWRLQSYNNVAPRQVSAPGSVDEAW